MLNIVLFEPEIPPNTGNVMRLCANAGARLHLVEPLGFTLQTKALRRAGLDYRDLADVHVHPALDACLSSLRARAASDDAALRVFAISTRGRRRHDAIDWRDGDVALFGAESRGLPDAILHGPHVDERIRLPMRPGMRSLNLSNAVAVIAYEAWRQHGFAGADTPPD